MCVYTCVCIKSEVQDYKLQRKFSRVLGFKNVLKGDALSVKSWEK